MEYARERVKSLLELQYGGHFPSRVPEGMDEQELRILAGSTHGIACCFAHTGVPLDDYMKQYLLDNYARMRWLNARYKGDGRMYMRRVKQIARLILKYYKVPLPKHGAKA